VIDLHAHLLPGLDDGARSLVEAVELCRRAAGEGCTDLVATPHRRRDEWTDLSPEALAAALAELAEAVGERPRLHLGAENRVDSDLLREAAERTSGGVLPLAGSRYLLLELEPTGCGPDPVALVGALLQCDWFPVIAHPEVTPCLAGDPGLVERLVAAGAFLQVTAASLTGDFGSGPRQRALALAEAGLAHFVASDAHRPGWRPTGLARARAELERRFGAARADQLTRDHAAAVLADQPLPVAAGAFR